MPSPSDRYRTDVLRPGWQQQGRKTSVDHVLSKDLVVEDAGSGFCGAVVHWENGLVVLEDRRGTRRSFPLGAGFLLEGQPVALRAPSRSTQARATRSATHTASGSRVGTRQVTRVALPSRIYVEGRHDAELVEKIWGDDLRHVGVVVEYLGGIDDLPALVAEFAPARGRRLGVLVDHLVPGSKESRIAEQVAASRFGGYVMVTGHRFIDIWQAVRPERLDVAAWPDVPRGEDWKKGTCARMGWPHRDQADIARAWQHVLGRVRSWDDLDPRLNTEVEKLIDFVTQDHLGED
ncbi:DUF3097 domain-containing protein [Desertihabitans brevis]|uniref:DUF3097 domain-containing protein n=1 Tax=Desertihabitans brevis TaxID=2268447 RepID=A0A367YTW4_9ACTN|nr:DUF3097 domain-containing protein [Desertihabitans brevis]RCK69335.1 DUF3097 domain-containing protein [Desertihabitans brevis]